MVLVQAATAALACFLMYILSGGPHTTSLPPATHDLRRRRTGVNPMSESERADRHGAGWLSVRSARSILSFYSVISLASAGSILSIGGAASILSIGSVGSILSIGSVGSILSIGSSGGLLSIGHRQPSAGSRKRRW
jgi:hypothetical protein